MQNNQESIFKGKEKTGLYKTFEKLCNKKNLAFLNDLVEKQDKVLDIEESKNKDDSLNISMSITNNIKEEKAMEKKDDDNNKNAKTSFFGFGRKKKEKI